ncbi:hypothetical protein [Borrelia sp. P9F1]|uniref:hypothetical protein n=1 Tax=Borrelia sp. P9F1 TaxID=3058374 RepID=UPI002649799A|nr:hypothetical protein [Borrelia sp. P9F1]WKC58568.1 hypothetical protein QYZ68_05045 [Borrelia sp. P9F1]
MRIDTGQVINRLKDRIEHELRVAGEGVLDTLVHNKITNAALDGVNNLYRKVAMSRVNSNKIIGNESNLLEEHTHFYDAVSLFFSIGEHTSMIPIYPLDFSLALDFENEEQYNLRGQLVGVLRSFKGGSLNLELPENTYFFDKLYPYYTGQISLYLRAEEQKGKARCIDKIKCLLENMSISSSYPSLQMSLDLKIVGIERIRDLSLNFEPLFPINVPYFVPIMNDSCFLNLVFREGGVDHKITLHNITGVHKNHKTRSEVKNVAPNSKKGGVGSWNYLYYGLEPANLSITANIYDMIDINYLKSMITNKNLNNDIKSLDGSSAHADKGDAPIYSKEEQVQELYRLFESHRRTPNNGVLPYEISLQSSLLSDMNPVNFGYYLQEIDIKGNAGNYIELELKFLQIREYGSVYPTYVPKNKELIFKRDASYKTNLLCEGKLDDKEMSRVKSLIKGR